MYFSLAYGLLPFLEAADRSVEAVQIHVHTPVTFCQDAAFARDREMSVYFEDLEKSNSGGELKKGTQDLARKKDLACRSAISRDLSEHLASLTPIQEGSPQPSARPRDESRSQVSRRAG